MVHELVKGEQTEEELKKNYHQVGEHLYINSSIKLELEPVDEQNINNIQVVFLMGGSGTRLLHITKDQFSKHMINVNGQPLSKYVYDLWVNAGFKNFCFLIDDTQKGESIKTFYKNGEEFGIKNEYSIEHGKLGSAGALKLAIESGVIKQSFINHYPDDAIVGYKNFPLDFLKICKAAEKQGYQIVVVCVPGTIYPYGEIVDENGRVIDFVEKPFVKKDSSTGLCWVSKEVFPLIRDAGTGKGEVKIERTVLKTVAKNGKMLKVLLPSEYWIPVNDDPNLKKFEEAIKSSA